MIYLVILLLIIWGVINFDNKQETPQSKCYLFFIWLILTLVAGLRYKVGGDTIGYFEQYKTWQDIGSFSFAIAQDSRFAIGYQLLWAICKSINPNFWFYQLVHAVIVNTTFFIFFRKTKNRTFLAILLYYLYSFFFYNMEILRAAIAVCVFIYSLKFYFDKKWLLYYGCSLIALLFHSEAIVLFLFPLVSYLNKVKITVISLFGIIILSFIVLSVVNLVPIVNDFIISIGLMENGLIDFYSRARDYNINSIIAIFIQILPVVMILYLYRYDTTFRFKGFLILYIILTILTLKYSVLIGRINDFITPIVLFCIANIFAKNQFTFIDNKSFFKITILSLFLFSTIFNYTKNTYYPDYKKYYPYSSVFSPQENIEREWYVRDMLTNR